MRANFTPYADGCEAYIRVRIPNGARPNRSILVYLPNGTALVVNNDQLLQLDADANAPHAPE